MGQVISDTIFGIFRTKTPFDITMIGLDGAGKTTILYTLVDKNEIKATIPTVGFNIEKVTICDTTFHCWDLGGQNKIRPMWLQYVKSTRGLIFVIDYQDHERWEEASQTLHDTYNHCEGHPPVLVLVNKVDNPNASDLNKNMEKLITVLQLQKLNCEVSCQNIAAKVTEHVRDPIPPMLNAFKWLIETVKSKKN